MLPTNRRQLKLPTPVPMAISLQLPMAGYDVDRAAKPTNKANVPHQGDKRPKRPGSRFSINRGNLPVAVTVDSCGWGRMLLDPSTKPCNPIHQPTDRGLVIQGKHMSWDPEA